MTTSTKDLRIPGLSHAQLWRRGGSSSVWVARRESDSQAVAIKVLNVRPDDVELATREVSSIAQLGNHEGVVTATGFGELESGQMYITMPFLHRSLADLTAPLPWQTAARLMRTVARTTQFAHGCGVLHRDIKPGNILLDDGHPRLADWGIAKLSYDTVHTFTEAPISAGFAAPERLLRKPGTVASDVYSLGATLAALIAGPASVRNEAKAIDSIATEDKLPEQLRDLVQSSTAHNVRERTPSANHFANELDELLAAEDDEFVIDLRDFAEERPLPDLSEPESKRRWRLSRIGVPVLLGFLVVGAFLWLRPANTTVEYLTIEEPFLCDEELRIAGAVSGLTPGGPIRILSPEVELDIEREADDLGRYDINWICDGTASQPWPTQVIDLTTSTDVDFVITPQMSGIDRYGLDGFSAPADWVTVMDQQDLLDMVLPDGIARSDVPDGVDSATLASTSDGALEFRVTVPDDISVVPWPWNKPIFPPFHASVEVQSTLGPIEWRACGIVFGLATPEGLVKSITSEDAEGAFVAKASGLNAGLTRIVAPSDGERVNHPGLANYPSVLGPEDRVRIDVLVEADGWTVGVNKTVIAKGSEPLLDTIAVPIMQHENQHQAAEVGCLFRDWKVRIPS